MHWTSDELDCLLTAYFEMLALEQRRVSYVKTKFNGAVQEQTSRSKGSIEFKFANISAVLDDLEMPYIRGYKPRFNYQKVMMDLVRERVGNPVSKVRHEALYEELEGLRKRSTGGAETAALPSAVMSPVDAPPPAGVNAAVAWFSHGLEESETARVLFLVGGPGAGKSEVAAKLTSPFQKIGDTDDGLAHRTYEYEVGSRKLVLINDATIPAPIGSSVRLSEEIERIVSKNHHAIICINRGVIVEELGRSQTEQFPVGQAVLDSLNTSGTAKDSLREDSRGPDISLFRKSVSDYLELLEVQIGGVSAQMVGCYVDICSLFEALPEATFDSEVEFFEAFVAPAYSVTLFRERKDGNSHVGEALFRKFIGELSYSVDNDLDSLNPILANLHNLSEEFFVKGLGSICRAGEIATGQQFTFREVWGILNRAVLGSLSIQSDGLKVAEWVAQELHETSKRTGEFDRLRGLASLRVHQGFFEDEMLEKSHTRMTADPVLSLLTPVDPCKDARPGDGDLSMGKGWASPILDAFASQSREVSPLALLLRAVQSDQIVGERFACTVTAFDNRLDSAYQTELYEQMDPAKRRNMVAWYARYLTRMFAFSQGTPGFRQEIQLWTEAWRRSPSLPDTLEGQIGTLLTPVRNHAADVKESTIPILSSRTLPIIGYQDRPRLTIRSENPKWSTERRGDHLLLKLESQSKLLAEIPLDFGLIREALTCHSGISGLSEATEMLSPTLERFRASQLIPSRLPENSFRIANQDYSIDVIFLKDQV